MSRLKMKTGVVFATVGTTKFDKMVATLTEKNALQALKEKGYNQLIMQIGNSSVLPNEENCNKLDVKLSYYKYKNSIYEDILGADLVIGHAGAGTCLEVLTEKKNMLVVVNEELMHNHQTELADKLSSLGFLFSCTCDTLVDTLTKVSFDVIKEMPPPEPELFSNYLNEFMGFSKNSSKKCQ